MAPIRSLGRKYQIIIFCAKKTNFSSFISRLSYWADAGKPGNNGGSNDFEYCLNDKNCAEVAVRGYMSKWKRDCNNDGVIDCLDFAAIHKVLEKSLSFESFYVLTKYLFEVLRSL